MLNLSVILTESARRHPERAAFVLGSERQSFRELHGAVRRLAGSLRSLGLRDGDRVALSCQNVLEFPLVYFAVLHAGGVVVPLNFLLKEREVAYHLRDSSARFYFCAEGTPELPIGGEGAAAFAATESCERLFAATMAEEAGGTLSGCPTVGQLLQEGEAGGEGIATVARQPGDTAVILYTSGTTGQPKGAELTHSNILWNARCCADMLRFSASDTLILVLPLFHSFGQVACMNTAVLAGATSILMPRFEPGATLRLMRDQGATLFAGVPTMFWALLQHTEDGSAVLPDAMRLAISGGASLPLEVLRGFEARFGVPVLEGYGLSETSPVASFNQLERERKPGTVGTPIWGVEMRVIGTDGAPLPAGVVGEIVVRGHNVMKGYFRQPEETAAAIVDGWFHTGDLGVVDEDGYFRIVDRTKDMIIRGGFNVYPREIEEILLEHPDISLAAVVGVPDEEQGEEVKAFIVPRAGAAPEPDAVIGWVKDRIAAYKYPRIVEIRESLPMTATGKILKRALQG